MLAGYRLIYRRGDDRVYCFVPLAPVSHLTATQRRRIEQFVTGCLALTADIVGLTWEHDGLLAAVRQAT